MKKCRIPLILAGLALVAACSDQPVSGPDLRNAGAMQGGISVLSWNVYVGTDVDAVILALSDGFGEEDIPVLTQQIQTLVATDFLTRAAAIADEIAARRPHVVGLQEITNFALHAPTLGVNFDLPFLTILQGALAERGLNYVVADQILNIDVSVDLPFENESLGMQDYDVMLVDADRVELNGTIAKTFDLNLVDLIGPVGGIELRRGYVLANLQVGGKTYTVVSTHLEAGESGQGGTLSWLRSKQATEIAGALAGAERAVVMGDLNDWDDSWMYQVFAGAGFIDAWAELHPGTTGLTCCHSTDLMNEVPAFYERIDYVLVRGIEHPVSGLHGSIEILGEEQADRIIDAPYYPLWPSDHAGLAASLKVPVAEELR